MSPTRIGLLLACLLCVAVVVPGGAGAADGPRIEGVESNPVTDGNEGEYIVLSVPSPTNLSGWRITDGRYEATLPSMRVEGRVAVSGDPRTTALLTDERVLAWDGYLPLSAEGDTLSLVAPNGTVVDRVEFGPVAERASLVRNGSARFVPRTHGPSLPAFPNRSPDRVTAFVLPDSPAFVLETLLDADERIWLAGYEFTDRAVTDLLVAKRAAGVDVRVLLDGAPVSGQPAEEPVLLDRLSDAGVPITVLDTPRRRFAFHHPKYAIVDDTALIMSENWKPSGVGGNGSRGWGVAIEDSELAGDLATVFETDAGWRDGIHWDVHGESTATIPIDRARPLDIDRHAPADLEVESARVVTAPDQAERTLRSIIEAADERIEIQQVSIGDVGFPLLEATRRAAERGVSVRIHLDDSWYVADANTALVAELESLTAETDVTVTMSNGPGRFGKIHNKGVVVDEEVVVLGSMNWNNASMRENREVIVVLRGDEVAEYYRQVLAGDRIDRTARTPFGYLAIALGVCGGAGWLGVRRVEFEP